MQRLVIAITVMIVALSVPALASSDATKINNGAKLMLREATDSLFCTYNSNGTVKYSYSEGGDVWNYPVDVDNGVDYPAIAADSTGRRWLVARKPRVGNNGPDAQRIYYFSNGIWGSVQTLYESTDELGPAGLAGGTSVVADFVYAAFLITARQSSAKYVVLIKYSVDATAVCTLATGSDLGDPSVAVEPYKADSNRVYVVWENNGVIYHGGCLDGRGSGFADQWLSTLPLSDTNAVSYHPCVNADRGRVVVAWAQGGTPDIYARQRLSGTWQDWDNLSNSANYASDWPTIALGDAVAVAWEEAVSAYDHHIDACIDFGSVTNIADNATVLSYPHIVLHPDGSDLYLHTFWSEPSWAVGHDKLDIN
jgi:hypothetical protein